MLIALRERGDTIVEVLIAVAVISMILGGAFVVTNRNFLNTRDAQERGNALKLVEGQVEQLKGLVATDSDLIFGASVPSPFCIVPGNNVTPPSVTDAGNAACHVNSAGVPTGVEPTYNLSIVRTGNTFTVMNQWTHVRGDITNQVSMKYRLYE